MDPTGGDDVEETLPRSDADGADIRLSVFAFLTEYGWFLLIGIALVAYLWQKYGAEYWSRHTSTMSQDPIGVVKKDDDANSILSRHEAMLAARQRMQEEQNRLSAIAKAEMAKREEEKRQQKIKEWELHQQGGGYRSKTHYAEDQASSSTGQLKKKPQDKKPLRPNDYNPLSGSGGCNYRPTGRRGFGGGGGG